jgi:hypothetical protein
MLSRAKTNWTGPRSSVAASLSLLMLWGWVAAPLCACRCAHAGAVESACHRHASHAPDRSAHPCEHACAKANVESSADLVATPASPEAPQSTTPVVFALAWRPSAAPRLAGAIERDVGPPLPVPLFQILRS